MSDPSLSGVFQGRANVITSTIHRELEFTVVPRIALACTKSTDPNIPARLLPANIFHFRSVSSASCEDGAFQQVGVQPRPREPYQRPVGPIQLGPDGPPRCPE